MGESDAELDIDQFIKAIHIRSVLWNPKHRNYTTEYKRDQAWKEICKVLDKDFHDQSLKKQKKFDSIVRKKFETLRDSYQREKYCLNFEDMVGGRNFKRNIFMHYDKLHFLNASSAENEDSIPTKTKRNSPPPPTKNSPYDELHFLNTSSTDKEDSIPTETKRTSPPPPTENCPYDKLHFLNTSSTGNEDSIPTETKRNSPPPPTENSPPPSKKKRNSVNELEKQNNPIEPKSIEVVMNKKNQMPTPLPAPASDHNPNEEDTLFLLSLVTEIKKIPQDNRLSARIDILETIKRWQTNHSQQICSLSPIRGVPIKDPTIAKDKFSLKLHKIFPCDICDRRYTTREELKSHKIEHQYGKLPEKKSAKDISMDVTLDCDELMMALKEESSDSNASLIMYN